MQKMVQHNWHANKQATLWRVKATGVGHCGDLRREMFKWNSENKAYLEFDQIKARQVVQIGWFQNFHRDYHDIAELRNYLKGKFSKMGVMLKFEIYVQSVWICGKKTQSSMRLSYMLTVHKK